MPRIVSIPLNPVEQKQLIDLTKHAAHWRERQRAQTILWLSEGKTVAEVAKLQSRIPETIRLQRRHWQLYQFESIQEGHRSGRPSVLTNEHEQQIIEWVNANPLNAEQIRVKLHEQFGISVNANSIRKFLRQSGMVFKRTRHSLKKKRNQMAFEQAQQEIELLREQASRGEIVLGYVDETGFSASPDNRYAWTKQGETHQVDAVRSKRVNVMGCLLSTGQLITSCLHESVTSNWFYAYLTGVAQRVKQAFGVPLVLIVDNASIHRSRQMSSWRDLLEQEYSTSLYFIPAYSPELNRIEMVWRQMNYHWRDFKVMTANQIQNWVYQISKYFGNKYMFTF